MTCFSQPKKIDITVVVISCFFENSKLSRKINKDIIDKESLDLKDNALDILKNKENIHQKIHLKIAFKQPYKEPKLSNFKKVINLWLTHIWTRDNQSYAIYIPDKLNPHNISPEAAKIIMRASGKQCRLMQRKSKYLDYRGEKTLKFMGVIDVSHSLRAVEVPSEPNELSEVLNHPLIIKGYD